MDLTPILSRIPQFASAKNLEVTELSGGITNKNYKISADGEAYVLRLGGNETQHLGIDRTVEYACTLSASNVGVAPDPIAFLEPEGYLVTRFVSGSSISADQIGTEYNIQRVVKALKLIHRIDFFLGSFSPFLVVENYAQTALRFGVKLPQNMAWYLDCAHEMETAMYHGRQLFPPCPCHNDLLNGNFIDDGTRIRILDWEYAGMGDLFFDLGNFAAQHAFNQDQDERLLQAYFDQPTPSHRARLQLMKVMSDLREAMWGVVQQGVSQLDFDYTGYAQKYFERFETATKGSAYSHWLTQA